MCSICDSLNLVSALSPDYTKRVAGLYDGIATQIWEGKFEGDIHPDLTRAMAAEFQESIEQAYGHSLDGMLITSEHYSFLSRAERSAYEFTTAKCATLVKDMKLIAKKATKAGDFHAIAQTLYTNMTEHYQETERIFAEGQVSKALRWREVVANEKLFPILEYSAIHDARVRPAHLALDGIRLPVRHPFWNTHRPPLDYRCRCKLLQDHSGPVTEPSKIATVAVPEPFINDKIDSGLIFNKKWSYFRKMNESVLQKISRAAADLAPVRRAYTGKSGHLDITSFHNLNDLIPNFSKGKVLADNGFKLKYNPHFEGLVHADFITQSGELLEVEAATLSKASTIQQRIRVAKAQAPNVMIELKDDVIYSPEAINRAIALSLHHGYQFDTLGLMHKGKVMQEYRSKLTSTGFKKALQDLLKKQG